jgi:hypothetical protein
MSGSERTQTDGVKAKEELYAPMSIDVDSIDLETEEESKEEKEDTESFIDIEVEGESKEPSISQDKSEVDSLKEEVRKLQTQIVDLTSKVKKPSKEEVSVEKKPEKLSRGQLIGIIKEHKDDPDIILNVIEHVAEQIASEIKDTTVRDLNQKTWSDRLSGYANQIIAEDTDGFLAANPNIKSQLPDMAINLGMGDYPAGQLAAYAIYRLTEQLKSKSSEDAESERERSIKSRKIDGTRKTPTGKQAIQLTQVHLDAAKKFGVKPETYAKFLRRT